MSHPTLAAQAESGIQSEGSHPEADPSTRGAAEAVSQKKSWGWGGGHPGATGMMDRDTRRTAGGPEVP